MGGLLNVTSVGILRGRPRGCRSPTGGILGNNKNHPSGNSQSVLFVCTGNIFRSVTAEYALKARLGAGTSYVVSSAGIDVKAQSMHEWVLARLREKGAAPTLLSRLR